MNLNEAKDLNVYKRITRTLSGYADKFPTTGVNQLAKAAISTGLKIVPKDKKALEILDHIFASGSSIPYKVQQFLNMRFSDLPVHLRPIYKEGNKKMTAFREIDGNLHDKVKSLVDFTGKAKAGKWTDQDGNKVELIELDSEVNKEE